MPSEDDQTIDFNKTSEEIDLKIRAFGKFNSCSFFDGIHWIVSDGFTWKEKHDFNPGEVVHKTNKEYLISCKDGFVCFRFFEKDMDYYS